MCPRQEGQAWELWDGEGLRDGQELMHLLQDSERTQGKAARPGRSFTNTEKMLNINNHREIQIKPQGDSASRPQGQLS